MAKRGKAGPIAVGVELIQDLSRISSPVEGYLRRHRHSLKTLLSDGTRTDTYVADFMDRDPNMRDAVAIVPFSRVASSARPGDTRVLLRRQVRYAAYLATGAPLVTEVLAGLIERPEKPEETAVRELYEEAALEVDLSKIHQLGRSFLIVPGIFTETIYPIAAEVPEAELEAAPDSAPPGDGSPFEEGAELVALSLNEALRAIAGHRSGSTPEICDAKTEVVLRRLLEALEGGDL